MVSCLCLAACCGGLALSAFAQLEVVSGEEPQWVFGGGERNILLTVHNRDSSPAEDEFRIHIFQAGSATVVRLGETPWKRLQVLGGQTILERVQVNLPAVASKTRFILKWADSGKHVIGNTEVLAYPQGLLKELKPMLGERPLGIYDPGNELRPLLKGVKIETLELEDSNQDYDCALAILGPFQRVNTLESLGGTARKLAERGTAVIWVRSSSGHDDRITPSFYFVHEGKGSVLIAEPSLVADLRANPKAQLNLIHMAQLSLNPELRQPQSVFVENKNDL